MATKKPLINKDRFKSLVQIAQNQENETKKENITSRFDISDEKINKNEISYLKIDDLVEAPAKWNFYSKLPEDKFLELVESIEKNFLLHPIVVWEQEGSYMVLSGHNRLRAFKTLYEITNDEKYLKIPAMVKRKDELDENMAREIIIDTNWIQRQLSTYEKTNSIIQKYVNIKKTKEKGYKTRDILAEQLGISGRMVQNYISLNNLEKEFFDMIDENSLTIKQAVILARLPKSIQKLIIANKNDVDLDMIKLKKIQDLQDEQQILNILSKNKNEQEFVKITYKIPKNLKEEFDKLYKEFLEKNK